MKKPLIVAGAILVLLIGGGFIGFYVFFGNISDRIEAMKIPRYPRAKIWDISASGGFPVGDPSAHIDFQTQDEPEKVMQFYKETLSKRGWVFEREGKLLGISAETKKLEEFGERFLDLQKNSISFFMSSRFYYLKHDPYRKGNYLITIHKR